MTFEGLRQVYGRLDEDLFWIAARAVQIVDWDRTHRFCGHCGVPMELQEIERAKKCPKCGLLHFPRLAPAIIVAIERGDKLLMARSRRFTTGMYSVLAGFVEPGESLEETVVREVKEEVGISIKDIQILRKPALALSALAHDRVYGDVCGRRDRQWMIRRLRMPAGLPSTTCRLSRERSALPAS